jgi:hypothetical protein
MSWSSKLSLSCRFPHWGSVYISPLSHTWHIFLDKLYHVIKVLFSGCHVLRATFSFTIKPNSKKFSPIISTRNCFLNMYEAVMLHVLPNLKWFLSRAFCMLSDLSHSSAKFVQLTVTIPWDCWARL